MVDDKTKEALEAAELERLLAGSDSFSERAAMEYIVNVIRSTDYRTAGAYHIASTCENWFTDLKEVGFPVANKKARAKYDENPDEEKSPPVFYKAEQVAKPNSVNKKDWDMIGAYFEDRLENAPVADEPTSLVNLTRLTELLRLNDVEKAFLRFAYVMGTDNDLRNFTNEFVKGDMKKNGAALAKLLDMPSKYKTLTKIIDAGSSRLARYGLLEADYNLSPVLPSLNDDLMDALLTEDMDDAAIIGEILGKPATTDLDITDFEYIGEDLQYIIDLLKNASDKGIKGVNILVYGPAGGGKTELVKTIAKHLEKEVYLVGEDGENNSDDAPMYDVDGDIIGTTPVKDNRSTDKVRLSQLLRTQALLEGDNKALAFFDEIEDLLIKGTDTDKSADTESKIAVNRLLENNPVPTVWAGNDPQKFHDAVRQRFTFSLYVDEPPVLVRKKIWDKQLALKGLDLPEETVINLARKYSAAPRQIAKAVEGAAITGKGVQAIEMALPASARISAGSSEAIIDYGSVSTLFDPELLNVQDADTGMVLDHLIQRATDREPFALKVEGPVGSGVSNMLRYVAEKSMLNPMEVSMASLSQPTQFSTPEQNVAGVFDAAANGRRFLIIHDIGHTVPRAGNDSDWRTESLARVFLEKAREHKLPFAVTSQDGKLELPISCTHIFSHHVKLQPLDIERAKKAFALYFEQEAPESLTALVDTKDVVIGDFARTSKLISRFPEGEVQPDDIVKMINEQRSFRLAGPSSIGFNAELGTSAEGVERQAFPFMPLEKPAAPVKSSPSIGYRPK